MYCVVRAGESWAVALLAGRRKDVMPGSFRSVRQACREADRLNAALEATRTILTPDSGAAVSAA
jgi:hypothetical protein